MKTLPSLSHQHCHSQLSSNYGGRSALQKEEENLTDLHSCHEWSSDHLQSHQLDVLSYPKSLLSYHSYTLGILMMALLFAVISGNSMTYLPGSWAKWTRQASLKIMIMETEGKIGIVLKFTRTFHILLSFHLAATHFQRRDKNTHEIHRCHCHVAENFMACKVWHFRDEKNKQSSQQKLKETNQIYRKDGC